MPKSADEVLMGVLSATLKVDEGSLSELKESDGSWKDDAVDVLAKRHVEHVSNLRGDVEKIRTERYSQGKREALEALERELRDEFGVKDTDKRGKDLVKAIVASTVAANGITDDKVRNHKLFLTLEEQLQNQRNEFQKQMEGREKELRSEFEMERTMSQALDAAHAVFEGMNPILPKDPVVARNQMRLLDDWIKNHKFTVIQENGQSKYVPLKQDGSGRLTDDHGHNVAFEDLVRQGARMYYEFAVGERKGSAPDPDSVGGASNGERDSLYNPKTQAEYASWWEAIDGSGLSFHEKQRAWSELKENGKRNGVVA